MATAMASVISFLLTPCAMTLWERTSTQNWQRIRTEEAMTISSLDLRSSKKYEKVFLTLPGHLFTDTHPGNLGEPPNDK